MVVEPVTQISAQPKSPLEKLTEANTKIWGIDNSLTAEIIPNMVLEEINNAPGATVDGFLKYLRDQNVTRSTELSLYTAAEKYVEQVSHLNSAQPKSPLEKLTVANAQIWRTNYALTAGRVANMVLKEINNAPGATVDGFLKYLRDQNVTRSTEPSMFTAVKKYVEQQARDRDTNRASRVSLTDGLDDIQTPELGRNRALSGGSIDSMANPLTNMTPKEQENFELNQIYRQYKALSTGDREIMSFEVFCRKMKLMGDLFPNCNVYSRIAWVGLSEVPGGSMEEFAKLIRDRILPRGRDQGKDDPAYAVQQYKELKIKFQESFSDVSQEVKDKAWAIIRAGSNTEAISRIIKNSSQSEIKVLHELHNFILQGGRPPKTQTI